MLPAFDIHVLPVGSALDSQDGEALLTVAVEKSTPDCRPVCGLLTGDGHHTPRLHLSHRRIMDILATVV